MNKIYQKPFPGGKNAGFTLIELLVVVLIIGILSAVALPQYQKAVARSRLAGMISLASSVAQSEQRYYMANGEYTLDAESLDIGLPSGMKPLPDGTSYMKSFGDGRLTATLYLNVGGSPRVSVHRIGVPSFILWGFNPKDYRYCGVEKSSPQLQKGRELCATYGPEAPGFSTYYYYQLN